MPGSWVVPPVKTAPEASMSSQPRRTISALTKDKISSTRGWMMSRQRVWRDSTRGARPPISPAQLRAALVELRQQVETHCDYVGPQFAEEARRIHYGEADPHGIYGEASENESRELAEEGIGFGRIPWVAPTDA